jgi:uncharacterized membrane protein
MESYLWLGTALFVLPHLFGMVLPGSKATLRARLGEGAYKGLYTLISLAGVVLWVLAYRAAYADPGGVAQLYEPWSGARHVTMLLVLLAFILIGASHGKGFIKTWVRNPMSWGIVLWAVGHLLANGEKVVVVIAASLLALAVLDIILCTVRGKRPEYTPRVRSDIIAVVVGLVLYCLFLFGFHPYILGVPVVG